MCPIPCPLPHLCPCSNVHNHLPHITIYLLLLPHFDSISPPFLPISSSSYPQTALCSEGDPMRLLFERDLTPHPQYAAFYKWLHLSLKPDCLIHFGTYPSFDPFSSSSSLCSVYFRFLFFPWKRVCAINPYHHVRSGQGYAILHHTTLHYTTWTSASTAIHPLHLYLRLHQY